MKRISQLFIATLIIVVFIACFPLTLTAQPWHLSISQVRANHDDQGEWGGWSVELQRDIRDTPFRGILAYSRVSVTKGNPLSYVGFGPSFRVLSLGEREQYRIFVHALLARSTHLLSERNLYNPDYDITVNCTASARTSVQAIQPCVWASTMLMVDGDTSTLG